ncbi:ribokinase [Colletotrichum paranaense]|uniref:Ribokinase n=1 Tax=Colletotrichum paranaense TaxID=1914294 RepID=A0ABQ9T3R4_9PEZI|nr:ribokinase [Colletotrichum paranaense]KAK1546415.1 ribokinase [Colletotrichum paranaense]
MAPNTKTIAVIGALRLDMDLTKEQPLPPGADIEKGVSALKDEAAIKGITTASTAYQTLGLAFEKGRINRVPDVRMVSVIGRDDYTEKIIAKVKEFKIGTDGIKIMPDKDTDVCFNVLTKSTGETERYREPNPATPACWTEKDFENAQSFGGDPKPDLIIISTELEKEVFTKILTCAKNNNIEVFLAKAPPYSIAESLLGHITYLVVDEDEAKKLSSENGEVFDSAKKLHELGVRNVFITQGHVRAWCMHGPLWDYSWTKIKLTNRGENRGEKKYTDDER